MSIEKSKPYKTYHYRDVDDVLQQELRFFGGLSFPVERRQIWDYAMRHQAAPTILHSLREIPERTYFTMEEFRKSFAEALENYGGTGSDN